ncbi:MAG: peptide deformylase [Robiginitomaculum sp.]|nr:MAG: peptide deformylase [Robiginitomaculum sp.]
MTIRPILTVPNPVLKRVSKPVSKVTDETRALMDDMLETMYDAPGIGLAAIQIGVPLNVIVMDIAKDRGEGKDEDDSESEDGTKSPPQPNPQFFINPEILESADELKPYEEGCLSVPEVYDEIERPSRVKIRYLDYHGKEVVEWAEGLYAICIQHEMDHLKGVLFIDYLSRLKRNRAVKKVQKFEKAKADA